MARNLNLLKPITFSIAIGCIIFVLSSSILAQDQDAYLGQGIEENANLIEFFQSEHSELEDSPRHVTIEAHPNTYRNNDGERLASDAEDSLSTDIDEEMDGGIVENLSLLQKLGLLAGLVIFIVLIWLIFYLRTRKKKSTFYGIYVV